MDRSTPTVLAINIVARPCIIAVPSMFIVAPTGITNEETSFLTPNSSVTVLRVTGIVAALDDYINYHDENAAPDELIGGISVLDRVNSINDKINEVN